jgi:hypothetical protein
MKTKILSYFLATIFFLSVFTSCDLFNNDDDPKILDKYLVSYEQQKTYLSAFITSILEQVSGDYPEMESIINNVEHGVTIYKISYTTTFDGEDHLASGLVCVPMGIDTFPVLSYQNGTNTLHSNAPTVNPDNELFLLLEFMASTGFIVTFPDYLGFGDADDMFHPYLDKKSTVQTIIDMQRATKEFVHNHLDIGMNDDLYIMGYSQGGWSTLQLQKAIEDDYSDIFNLKASACGAGPYNLNYINEYILEQTDYPMPYYVGYMFNSYFNLGLSTPANEIFNAPFDTKITTLFDGTNSGTTINDELTTRVADLFTADFINGSTTDAKYEPIVSMLTENSIEAWKTTTPTMLLHGTADNFVPTMGTNRMFQNFLNQGVGANTISMIALQGEDHQSGIIPSGIKSINWILELKNEE